MRKGKAYNIPKKGVTAVEEMGMTNEQYKGMLIDELADWKDILRLATKADNKEIIERVEMQIAKIEEKLKF